MDPSVGQNWFLRGKKLMEEFEDVMGDSVEVVAYHMLAAGSLMEAEKLRQAALHTVRALHTARSIGLNDKTRWKQDPDEIIPPRCLLLVLYFQEKRVHFKCGISYLLHPEDVNVDEFLPIRDESGIEDPKLELVEAMVSYSKLWTAIWPEFAVPNAKFAGNWGEMQIADAKVVIGYQELPQKLLWNTSKFEEYVFSGISEPCIRQKLQAFLWHQSLRLIIRQTTCKNPNNNAERQKSGFAVCKDIVAAITSYIKQYVCPRPLGYFLTCSLVDCVFHIKQEERDPLPLTEQTDMQALFKDVKLVLETMAEYIGCARPALEALRCVLVMSSDWDFSLDAYDYPDFTGLASVDTSNRITGRDKNISVDQPGIILNENLDFLGLQSR